MIPVFVIIPKKRRGFCNHLRPSVRPLDHWRKSNQIWCVSCSHEWGVHRHIFLPHPWGPREGLQGKISLNIIKFQLQSQLQRFLNQTLCVFSHMKDIKHIRRIFIWPPGSCPRSPGSCPRSGTWGNRGELGCV